MFWHQLDRFLRRLRPHQRGLSVVVDALTVVLAWQVTHLFRLGFERWFSARSPLDLWVMLGVVAIYVSAFAIAQVPRGLWRFAGFDEVTRLAAACLVAGLLSAVIVLMLQISSVPRAVLALHPVITLASLVSLRIAYRMLHEHLRLRLAGGDGELRRTLVLGAGNAARLLLAGLQHEGWLVVGLLDDDPQKLGARIGHVRVLGRIETLALQARELGATHVVIAMPSLRGAQRRRVIDLAAGSGLVVMTVPSAQELVEGREQGRLQSRVRDIEPADLLGREPVLLDEAGIAESLGGRCVLVTGAGGSIGSELCRQVARYGPRRLVLLEQSEFNLYSIEQELGERFPQLPLVRLIGDVKDELHLQEIFGRWQPQVVFHAAAYKHVPLMEDENAWAALRNNTLGTHRVASAALEAGAERFVLISTDKAVNPTSVMGATKRAAEMAISQLAQRARETGSATRFLAVRFGNVLGSSGSVVPKFKEQIARGGPVTVTHPEITRYFMTIPEATRLVLQTAAMGEGGQVYVLDMGEPVRIVDLARDLIRMAGHTVEEIGIVYSGLRPGEKLYEELLHDADATLPTANPKIAIARIDDGTDAAARVAELLEACRTGQGQARALLQRAVPEFRRTVPARARPLSAPLATSSGLLPSPELPGPSGDRLAPPYLH